MRSVAALVDPSGDAAEQFAQPFCRRLDEEQHSGDHDADPGQAEHERERRRHRESGHHEDAPEQHERAAEARRHGRRRTGRQRVPSFALGELALQCIEHPLFFFRQRHT